MTTDQFANTRKAENSGIFINAMRLNRHEFTYFLKSQIRTLSEAAIYRLPDAPSDKAVTGDSPGCVKPRFAVPDSVLPDEQSVFIALKLLERKSQTRTNAPHAENSTLNFGSCSMPTHGPACDKSPVGPLILFKSHMRTVRSGKRRKFNFE